MQKNNWRTIGGPGFSVPDIQHARIDLLQRAKRGVRPRLDRGSCVGFLLSACASAEPIMPSWAAAMVMAAIPRKRRR